AEVPRRKGVKLTAAPYVSVVQTKASQTRGTPGLRMAASTPAPSDADAPGHGGVIRRKAVVRVAAAQVRAPARKTAPAPRASSRTSASGGGGGVGAEGGRPKRSDAPPP